MNVNLQHIIQQIDANQDLIASKGKFSAEVLKKINYKLRLDWNYYSNRMEGGTLTREETRSVMVGNIDVKGKPFKDVAEMNGHDKIVQEVLQMSRGELRLSERRIKDIHKAIMHEEVPQELAKIGVWKMTANEIINYQLEKFDFANPSDVPDKVHELLNSINAFLDKFHQGKAKQHPLEAIGKFHLEYLTIHPFYDGNGRTARILTNILLMSCGYPLIIIKEEQKSSYYKLLADIQVYGGDIQLLLSFLGERILETQKIVINAFEGKEIEDPDDLDKEIAMLKRMQEHNKIVLRKNKETFLYILKSIYFPLLEELQIPLSKFYTLFQRNKCLYYSEELSKINPDYTDFKGMISYLKQVAASSEDGTSGHDYKATFRMEDYKEENNFDLEIALKLFFEEEKYRVEVYVGGVMFSNTWVQHIQKFVPDDQEEENKKIIYTYEYSFLPNIKELVKDITKQTLEVIKLKALNKDVND